MKNIAKILMVALLIVVATVSVYAAPTVEVELTEVGTKGDFDNVYTLDFIYTDEAEDALYVHTSAMRFTLNTEKIQLFSMEEESAGFYPFNSVDFDLPEEGIFWRDYMPSPFVVGDNGKTGRNKKTNALAESMIISENGSMLTVSYGCKPSNDDFRNNKNFPKTGFRMFSVGVYLCPGVSVEDLTSDDFKIERAVITTNDGENDDLMKAYGYKYSEAGMTTLNFVNNVTPEASEEPEVPTGPVLENVVVGDLVYVDGEAVEVTEDGNLVLDAEDGAVVVVNPGYASQKVYTVAEGALVEDEELAATATSKNDTAVVRNKELNLEAGVKFSADFVAEVAEECGFIGSVRNANGIGDGVLVDGPNVVKARVDVTETKNYTAFVSGIPADATGTIVVRPYFVISGVMVYGAEVEFELGEGWSANVDAE